MSLDRSEDNRCKSTRKSKAYHKIRAKFGNIKYLKSKLIKTKHLSTKELKAKKLKAKKLKVDQYTSNNRINYDDIEPGQFSLRVRNNALEIYAKDENTNNPTLLYGSVPLKPLRVPPKYNPSGNNNNDGINLTVPYKVVYIDQPDYWWPLSKMAQTFYDAIDIGFNVLILAFLVNGQAADMVSAWSTQLNAVNPDTGKPYREEILEYAHQRNSVILVSTGGATETDYWNTDPTDYGTTVANFAKDNLFDGVDFDLEHFSPNLTFPGFTSQQTIDWLVTATNATRGILGSNAIITHAPQAPYFGPVGSDKSWAGPLGGYTAVYKGALSINFFNIQCYNQGDECYTTYETIFINSCANFPESAFTQFDSDVPLEKLVLGKPMRQGIDAGSGYNTPQEINSIMIEGKNNLGWTAGVMTWQWPYRDSNDPPVDGKDIAGPWLDTVMNNF